MRIALTNPPHCAACYAQQPDVPHVDYESAYDGPVIEGAIKVSIDDLILCENCVKRGAELVGMIDDEQTRERLRNLEVEVAQLEGRLAERLAYCDQLEATISAKPKPPTRRKAATK